LAGSRSNLPIKGVGRRLLPNQGGALIQAKKYQILMAMLHYLARPLIAIGRTLHGTKSNGGSCFVRTQGPLRSKSFTASPRAYWLAPTDPFSPESYLLFNTSKGVLSGGSTIVATRTFPRIGRATHYCRQAVLLGATRLAE